MSPFDSQPHKTITIAVSCSALLDLAGEYQSFQKIGYESFYANQVLNQHLFYKPGALLPFVRSLNYLNSLSNSPLFRIILISSNCKGSVKRALNSLEKYAIDLDEVITLNGAPAHSALIEHQVDIFFTKNLHDAEIANQNGIPGIHIADGRCSTTGEEILHIAFDADGVLFDSASHIRYLMTDLETFDAYEFANQVLPLAEGPLMPLVKKLSQIKRAHPMLNQLIKLSVVSSRSEKAMSRVITSAQYYRLAFEDFIACDGQNKGPVLKNIQAHLFLDDEHHNIQSSAHYLPSGRVMTTNFDFEHCAA